jgi:hypothetical protein
MRDMHGIFERAQKNDKDSIENRMGTIAGRSWSTFGSSYKHPHEDGNHPMTLEEA